MEQTTVNRVQSQTMRNQIPKGLQKTFFRNVNFKIKDTSRVRSLANILLHKQYISEHYL